MRRAVISLLATVALLASLLSCNDYETYGDQKEKERKAIKAFISEKNISVIAEKTFRANGCLTDTLANEYVYLDNTGVYMQVVHQGCGTPLRDGENSDLLVRYIEMSLLDSTAIYNDVNPYDVDVMNVKRQGNTFTASFTSGLWLSAHSSSTVPSGILAALPFLNMGRPRTADDQIAKVRLIVPHTQGTAEASGKVCPYYYEISFQRKTDL